MKQMFRAVVLLLLVGGWALASSAIHVVRTPSNIAIVTKDRPGFHDTWVDTRKWTIADDQAHPAVVARLVHLGRPDLLRHTLPANVADAEAALIAIAAAQPAAGAATTTGAGIAVDKVEDKGKAVVDLVKREASKL